MPRFAMILGCLAALALALPQTAAAKDKALCEVGNPVQVEWEGQWYDAEVVGPEQPDGTCPITYIGFDSSWDEAVPPSRLREAPTGLCVVGGLVDVEWDGDWFKAEVLDWPRPDGTCYITYTGWDSSWDEWVTPDRMRERQ